MAIRILTVRTRENGLPRQCAHWLAMTEEGTIPGKKNRRAIQEQLVRNCLRAVPAHNDEAFCCLFAQKTTLWPTNTHVIARRAEPDVAIRILTVRTRENGLPRQCAHWLAMTEEGTIPGKKNRRAIQEQLVRNCLRAVPAHNDEAFCCLFAQKMTLWPTNTHVIARRAEPDVAIRFPTMRSIVSALADNACAAKGKFPIQRRRIWQM